MDDDEISTFRNMFRIIGTNHLSHELTELDWEVIDLKCPDIRMPEGSIKEYRAMLRKRAKRS